VASSNIRLKFYFFHLSFRLIFLASLILITHNEVYKLSVFSHAVFWIIRSLDPSQFPSSPSYKIFCLCFSFKWENEHHAPKLWIKIILLYPCCRCCCCCCWCCCFVVDAGAVVVVAGVIVVLLLLLLVLLLLLFLRDSKANDSKLNSTFQSTNLFYF
jgi:hypothetical protein